MSLLALLIGLMLIVPDAYFRVAKSGPSQCTGTPAAGSATNTVPLTTGDHVESYCSLCTRLLRNYGHERAVAATQRAYADLRTTHPATTWVFGEIGWPWGGAFRPHRTHQNGQSFDYMVPLRHGRRLPTHVFNRFGYGERFDAAGMGTAGSIDFEAIAAHLNALQQAARAQGGAIARVIFAPDLQDDLFRAAGGRGLPRSMAFSRRPAWVRHDNHYHVNFAFPCGR